MARLRGEKEGLKKEARGLAPRKGQKKVFSVTENEGEQTPSPG